MTSHVAHPQINSREAASFKYAIRLERPFGWVDSAIQWCRTELIDEWRWQLIRPSNDISPGEYVFYFDADRDYFAFSMKFI